MAMDLIKRIWAAIPAKPFVFGYLALYAATLTGLTLYTGFDPTEALFVLFTLGVVFTFVARLLTREAQAPAPSVPRPRAEALALFAYLVVYAFGFLGWGLSWLKHSVPDPRLHYVAVTAAKLLSMVLLPTLLLSFFGHMPRELLRWNFHWKRHGFAFAVIALLLVFFQLVFGHSLQDIGALHAGPGTLLLGLALCFVYLCLDTGLTEEFLFRVVIQTRAAALFGSETAGVVVMALLFGLAHAPGYYLRAADSIDGGHPTWGMALGYTVVMVSVFGFMFGMLWARTRSLGLVVMVHASTDLLPNVTDFIRSWL
jgi:membrane protease YdiL (CAAX protease family)